MKEWILLGGVGFFNQKINIEIKNKNKINKNKCK